MLFYLIDLYYSTLNFFKSLSLTEFIRQRLLNDTYTYVAVLSTYGMYMKHIDLENIGIWQLLYTIAVKQLGCVELSDYHDSHFVDVSGYVNKRKFYKLRGSECPRKTPQLDIGYVVLDNFVDISEYIEAYSESLLTHDVTVSEFCAILYGRGWIPFIDEYVITVYDVKQKKEIVFKTNDLITL